MQDLPCVLSCLNCLILQLVHELTDACLNELCTVPHFLHLHRCYLMVCIYIYMHCIVADLEDFYELSVQWKLKTISFLRQVLYVMLPWLCCVSMDLEVLYKSASPSSFSSGNHFFWAVPNKFPYLGMFVFQQQAAAGGSQEGGKKRTKATAKKTKASECAHGI